MKLGRFFNKWLYPPTPSRQIENKPKQSNICFVNFSKNGRENYEKAQQDLINSIKKYSSYDMLMFSKYEDIGSPTHQQSSHSFKVYAIKKAKELGYEIVIWVDASMRLIKPIDPLVPKVKELGIYIQEDGWTVGEWANDKSLEYFGVSRDDAMKIPNASSGIMIFDFTQEITNIFFEEFFKCSLLGLFNGNCNNTNKTESQDERCLGHRHDQTCLELLAHKFNISKQPMIWGPDPSIGGHYFTTWDNNK